MLKETYYNPKRIKWELVLNLWNIKGPTESHLELDNFATQLDSILLSLEAQGVKIESPECDIMTIPGIFHKLPNSIRAEVQRRTGEDYPSLSNFRKSLRAIVNNKITMESKKKTTEVRSKDDSEIRKDKEENLESHLSSNTIGNFAVTNAGTELSNFKRSCLFCSSEEHKSLNCDFYEDKQAREKRALLSRFFYQ